MDINHLGYLSSLMSGGGDQQAASNSGYFQNNSGKIQQGLSDGGYVTYDNYLGGGEGKPVLGQTTFDRFDKGGNFMNTGTMKSDNPLELVLLAMAAAGGMHFGLPGLGGGNSAGAGAGLSGTGGTTAAANPFTFDFTPGLGQGTWDAGLGSITDAGIVNSPLATPTVQAPLPMGQGEWLKAIGAPMGTIGAPTGVAPGLSSSLMPSTSTLKDVAQTGGAVKNLAQDQKSGGMTGADLASIIGGIMDYRGNQGMSDDMLKYMREQQGKIDNLFAPGSPEWNQMWESMSRADAKAGRNSQYGARTTDFLAKIADTKAKYTADLTKGLAGNYQEAFRRDGPVSNAALSGAIKGALRNPENLSSVVSKMKDIGSSAGSSFEEFVSSLWS